MRYFIVLSLSLIHSVRLVPGFPRPLHTYTYYYSAVCPSTQHDCLYKRIVNGKIFHWQRGSVESVPASSTMHGTDASLQSDRMDGFYWIRIWLQAQ